MPGINGCRGDAAEVTLRNNLIDERSAEDWGERAERGFLASGIDPGIKRAAKTIISIFSRKSPEEMLNLKGMRSFWILDAAAEESPTGSRPG